MGRPALVRAMGVSDTVPWKWFESRTPSIFLVAGALFVGYTGIKVARLVTDITVPDVVSVAVGTFGLLVLALGLLGFYPRVRSTAPLLTRAGVVTSVLSGVCSIVLLVALIDLMLAVKGLPAIPEQTGQGIFPPFMGGALLIVTLFSLLLGFLLFGVASLRTDAVPSLVASILLVPSIMWTTLFVLHVTSVNGTLIGVIVYPPIAASVLTVGYLLRAEKASSRHVTSPVDSPA